MRYPAETNLDWFGGNKDVQAIFHCLAVLAHTWDDMVDKNVDLDAKDINQAFMIALVTLPQNPLYRAIQDDVAPLWSTVIMAYDAANSFEEKKDGHGIEIAHNLRYAGGHIIAYALKVAVGYEKALELMPNIWKQWVPERFDEYRKEHLEVKDGI